VPIKFVAAEAGFLPLGPLTFFADIVSRGGVVERERVCTCPCSRGIGPMDLSACLPSRSCLSRVQKIGLYYKENIL
jgi:hypothetical protein